jgi:GntR family transcriptional regulator, transcriptional repressor for pyruvate dehydrogenase complex
MSTTASDGALQQIMALIFDGGLSPGSKLPSERDLSVELGVSRTTIRDAINRLKAQGYIQSRSKSGNFVCTVLPPAVSTPIEEVVKSRIVGFQQIIELREVLELWGVDRAARAADKRSLAKLRKCLKTMEATSAFRTEGQFQRYSQADLQFHQTIAEMTGNPMYAHLIHFIGHLITQSISLSRELVSDDFSSRNLAVHRRIYNAIRSGDPPAARAAMTAHFKFVKVRLGAE